MPAGIISPLALALVAVFLACLVAGQAAEETNTFQVLRGRAALSRNGGSTWLDLGPEPATVKIQDMIRTEAETRGELRFADGSLFRVKSNSVVTLLADGLQIQVGESWLNLRKQGRTFQVITPTTVCGVLGTTFDVAVDKFGRTQVRVYEGLVGVRARDDQRRRQVVLQRGMQTAVKNRGFTGEQIQKFDPRALESELNKEWDRRTLPPMKIGPDRPGLPPIRPSLPDGFRPLHQPGPPDVGPGRPGGPGGPEGQAPADVRDRLNFFDSLREQRLQAMERAQAGHSAPAPREAFREPYPDKPYGPGAPGKSQEMLREGHGRPFGQATPRPTGLHDERTLREEMLRVQNELTRVQEEIAQIEAEQKVLQNRANELGKRTTIQNRLQPAGSTLPRPGALYPDGSAARTPQVPSADNLDLTQIRERIQQLQARLSHLREQQQKLVNRLTDLRNRLR